MYKTSQIATMFNVSAMTVGRWVKSFSVYLSHTAVNADGTQRRFTEDDLKVFAYIALLKSQGNTLDLIAVGLANGERAEPPAMTSALATAPSNELTVLRTEVTTLRAEVERLRDAAAQNILLERQLAAAQAEIKALNREIGRLEAKSE